MKSSCSHSSSLGSMKGAFAAAVLLGVTAFPVLADSPSILPAFGTDGVEFTVKSKNGNTVQGWLPKDWNDNTDWAPVSATYTKLTDAPDKTVGAVQIKVEKVEEGGQLQLTTYQGNQKYTKGTKYVVSGWVRSAGHTNITVGARQMEEPYEFYHEQELSTGSEWKRFEFAFTPMMDIKALIMFVVHDVGSVDLAGVTVDEKP